MSARAGQRLRSWLLFLAGAACIIVTIDVAFETSLFLRSRGFLWRTVELLFAATAATVAYLLVARARLTSALAYLRSLPAVALFVYAMVTVRSAPSERFHFVEYGVLYLLALRAAVVDARGVAAYFAALAATVLAGWIDECAQGLSAVRYYDVADIKMNALAALLAGLVFFSLFGARPARARFAG
ncbi:MAG: VanZ family protein [Planctomycetes bacterium]|nr:VanZ family protein [Planctomycetota bacterium]